jgi:hypothetical protein
MINIALTEDDKEPGKTLAHAPNCSVVQAHRIAGRPIMTMLGCEGPLPDDMKKHSCLEEKK